MMAVRYGVYKAHYWTWTNNIEEFDHVSLVGLLLTNSVNSYSLSQLAVVSIHWSVKGLASRTRNLLYIHILSYYGYIMYYHTHINEILCPRISSPNFYFIRVHSIG